MSFALIVSVMISLVVMIASATLLVRLATGLRQLRQLAELPERLPAAPPRVSIVVSALNEAATLEPALRSLLALDYPDMEIIAIDDRSTDATGEILDRLEREDARLRVLHIRELPSGWLGKNHALQRGSELASGKYLLFTDADVVFERGALRRAVAHCESERLDHLVVLAEFIVRERLLAMLLLGGTAFMLSRLQPWKVNRSPHHFIGMGAFNMVRASAYRSAGGHGALALEVVEDILLGRLLKAHGARQDALLGVGSVAVEWYPGTRAMMHGLEKNSFAMLDYRFTRLLGLTAVALPLHYWPWVGLWCTQGLAWWFNVASLCAALATYFVLLRLSRWSPVCLIYWPLLGAVSLFILWRGVLLALWRGGVFWRGTRYTLEELRRGHAEAVARAQRVAS